MGKTTISITFGNRVLCIIGRVGFKLQNLLYLLVNLVNVKHCGAIANSVQPSQPTAKAKIRENVGLKFHLRRFP